MQPIPYLAFDGICAEAMRFYAKNLGGKLDMLTFGQSPMAEHTPKEAADHLRLKWKNAGGRVKKAPDFIQYCASESSLSGKPYEIRFKDGRTVLARDWLWTELKRMEAER